MRVSLRKRTASQTMFALHVMVVDGCTWSEAVAAVARAAAKYRRRYTPRPMPTEWRCRPV